MKLNEATIGETYIVKEIRTDDEELESVSYTHLSREAQKKHCQQPHFLELSKIKEKYVVETDIQIEDQESK